MAGSEGLFLMRFPGVLRALAVGAVCAFTVSLALPRAAPPERLVMEFEDGTGLSVPGLRLGTGLWVFSVDLGRVPVGLTFSEDHRRVPPLSVEVDPLSGLLLVTLPDGPATRSITSWSLRPGESWHAQKGATSWPVHLRAVRSLPGLGEVLELEGEQPITGSILLDEEGRVAAWPLFSTLESLRGSALPSSYLRGLAVRPEEARWVWPGALPAASWRQYQKGLRSLFAGQPQEALELFDQLPSKDLPGPDLEFLAATALAELDRREEAIARLADILRSNPDYAGASAEAGGLFFSIDGFTRAATLCRQSLPKRPLLPDCHGIVATTSLLSEDYQTASEHFQKLIELSFSASRRSFGWLGAGSALAGLDRHQDALEAFAKARSAAERWRANPELGDRKFGDLQRLEEGLQLAEARSLAKLSRWREAVRLFRQALQQNPALATGDILVEYGEALSRQGLWDEAAGVLERATRQFPESAPAFQWLGVAYSWKGRWEAALEALKTADRLRPNHPETLYHLAISLLRLNHRREAQAIQQRLDTLDEELAAQLARQLSKPRSEDP